MLSVRGIYKTFHRGAPDQLTALENLTLDVQAGQFLVIVGTNGSGKSTLLNVIAGDIPPDTGHILLGSTDITSRPAHKRAAMIARVFQDPFAGTIPHMTIEENLALAGRRGKSRGLVPALNRAQREEMRERLADLGIGLEHRLTHPVHTLSGGQRQALTLLMATWGNPILLLLDEHTAALDPKSADLVLRLTRRVIEEHALTVLMVTHSMQQAVHFGDRLVMMHHGRIVYDISGLEKRRAHAMELVARFEDVRAQDLIDASTTSLLKKLYI
jgi:putative ABC transport system ATP-binding protein